MKRLVVVLFLVVAAVHLGRSFASDKAPRCPLGAMFCDSDQTHTVTTRTVHVPHPARVKIKVPKVRVLRTSDRPSRVAPPAPPTPPSPPAARGATTIVLDEATVTDPELAPSWFNHEADKGSQNGYRTIKGAQKATVARADESAREALNRAVTEWLGPEVPVGWKPAPPVIDSMILDRYVAKIDHDYGPLYVEGYRVEFSKNRRDKILQTYHRQMVAQRLTILGGGLGFVLACLAALVGYIRADEATKGYYTNRLRLLTAAGVGAAGVVAYQVMMRHV